MDQTRSIGIAAVPRLADTRITEIIASKTILTVLAVVVVILRFLTRSLTTTPRGLDDWLILFALVISGDKQSNHSSN